MAGRYKTIKYKNKIYTNDYNRGENKKAGA